MDLTQIGKYKVLSFIGQGAMGSVYKAHDPILNRFVAIKTISSVLAGDIELRKRFQREAQAAGRLNHPNIITVYDYGEEGDTIFIAMELLEGTDLKEFLSSGALKSLGAKLQIMEQICDGLAFAHSKGVIHRDLKPANIHVTMGGQVKIMDFGLARLDSGDRSKAGIVVGTPNYMSPEQVMGDEIDDRTDIFSAGAVFYELLANKKPFDADSVHGILFQVVHKQPTPVRELSRELPPIVGQVVEKALAKDRGHRFQTATELREALTYVEHALASGRPQEARLSRPGDKTLLPSKAPLIGPRPSAVVRADAAVDGTVALDMSEPVPRPALPPSTGPRSKLGRADSPRVVPARPGRHFSGGAAFGMVGLALAIGAGVAFYLEHGASHPSPPPGAPTAGSAEKLSALTKALVTTKLELAKAELADKDYKAAITQAEEALRLAPTNADAQRLRGDAHHQLDLVEAAAAEVRAAVQAGDNKRAGAALSNLLSLDPRHPVALEVSAQLNSSFRQEAEEARRTATQARAQAERAGAAKGEAFAQAAGLVRDAEGEFRRGGFADATRDFLESRDVFERARRAAQSPPPTPAVAAAVPSVSPVPAVTPVTTAAPPPLPSAEPAPPLGPRRAFSLGDTVLQNRSSGSGLAGFEGASVQKASEFRGRIDVEFTPAEVRGGDPFTIKAAFTSLGRRPVRIHDAVLTFTVNGQSRVETLSIAGKDVPPQQAVALTETGGVWDDGIESWSLQIAVTSDKGDVCMREIRLR